MVILVCPRCRSPLKTVSNLQGGVEIISYQCTACNHTSSSFLLGYVPPNNDEIDEAETTEKPARRAALFAKSTESYRLRAKMQALVNLKNDVLLQAGSTDVIPDADQE